MPWGTLVPSIFVIGAAWRWAVVRGPQNINSLPMVVDTARATPASTFIGFYYLASQPAAIAGPVLNGYIEKSGNYGLVLLMPVISSSWLPARCSG